MTTVVWDGKSLAADRRCGGTLSVGKIFRLPDGSYLAGAGAYSQIVEVVTWIASGSDEKDRPALDAEGASDIIHVTPTGECYWLSWPYLRPVQFYEPHATVGSGSDFALGALAMGATAKQAVQIAARYDGATGNGIDVVHVVKADKPARKRKAAK